MTAWEETPAGKWGQELKAELDRELRYQDAVGKALAEALTAAMVGYNAMVQDVLSFLAAAATTGQRSPFQPFRILGWAPGWTE